MKQSPVTILVVILALTKTSQQCRPVVLVHGLFGDEETWLNTTRYLNEECPGIDITISHKYEGIQSVFTNMWEQVNGVYNELKDILTAEGEGVTLICYSQGGLVCRGLLETYSDLNVHTFISLSAPLAGQYGLPDALKKYMPINASLLHDVYKIVYKPIFQDILSIANYWNDPLHRDMYRKKCIFLPKLDNFTEDFGNFVKIKQMVLIGGEDDGVITPWQSSQFGFFAENSETDVVNLHMSKIYQDNAFGLKTLYDKDRIRTCTINGVSHTEWPQLSNVFEQCIKEWIK